MKAVARAGETPDRARSDPGHAATARLPARPTGSGLTIGRADAPAEREADVMAEQALAGVPLLRPSGSRPAVRRTCAACAEEEDRPVRRKQADAGDRLGGSAAPPAVASLLAQPGRSLDPAARSFFERRFARSFGDVQVHDGPAANTAARAIDARAFTAGSHIAFAGGEYEATVPLRVA